MSATDMTLGGEGSTLAALGEDPDDRTDGLDGYAVKLAVFEGPLDLLLHLIRQRQMHLIHLKHLIHHHLHPSCLLVFCILHQ